MTFWLKPDSPGPIWRFFSSIWLAVGLMLWVGVVCILGTVLGVQEAEIVFFKAWWLSAILGALMLNLTICTLNRSSKPLITNGELTFPWRLSQIPFLLVHLGLLTVFSAKIITNMTLLDAQLSLSERPPSVRQLPPHEDNTLMLKKRTIIAKAIPSGGLEDTYRGCFVEMRTAEGDQLRGWVREQEGGLFKIKREDNGELQTFRKEEIHSLLLAQAHPVFLNHLETTDDLQNRTPYALSVGIVVSLIFLILAYFAGRFFSDGSAPLITGIVFGFLVIALYLEMPTWQLDLFRDRFTLSYKKYYPHATMEDRAVEGLDPNPAIRYRFNAQETWLFYEEQGPNLRINEEEVFSSPLNQGPIEVHYLRFDNQAHRESYLAQAAQGTEGSLVLRNRRDPSRTLRIPVKDSVGKAFAFGGHQVRIVKLYENFRIRKAQDSAGPSPESRPASETYDAGGLENPAIEIKISDEMSPRYDFAWFPGLRRRLNQSVTPHPVIDYRYERPRPFRRPAIAFTRYADTGKFTLLVLDKEGPAQEYPLEVGEDSPDVSVELSGGKLNLGIARALENFESKRELVPVTPADRENWKDYSDAVFVEVVDNNDPTAKASGWLRFQSSLALRVGRSQMLLRYDYQRKKLPFKLRLDQFQVITHPGTNNPAEFRSEVTVLESKGDGGEPEVVDRSSVYMNHTYDRDGYRFFQSSYMMPPGQPKVSVFSVAKDPGTKPFYAGCIILCFGVMTIFFVKPSLIKIEKRRARVAAGLPAEGPLSKEDLAAAKARSAKAEDAKAIPKAKRKEPEPAKTEKADEAVPRKDEELVELSTEAKAEDPDATIAKAEAEAAKAEAEAAKAEAEAAKAEAALAKAEAAKAKAEAAKAKAEVAKAAAEKAQAEAAQAEAEAAESAGEENKD